MSSIFVVEFSVDEVQYFIDYFTANIANYNLDDLTNSNVGDIPSINNAHPLALEYGNVLTTGDKNFTSILPAIGVELINDNPHPRQVLGKGKQLVEITQAYHDAIAAIPLKDRYKNGKLISDVNLALIQSALTAKAGEKLYAYMDRDLQDQTVNISVWSNDLSITRYVYLVVRSLLHRIDQDGSAAGLKNMNITGINGLYNYDFSETLFGGEFNVSFIQQIKNIEIDTALIEMKKVEHQVTTGVLPNKEKAGVTGKGIGE